MRRLRRSGMRTVLPEKPDEYVNLDEVSNEES